MDLCKIILFHTKWGVLELGLYFKSIDQSKYIEYVTSFGKRNINLMVDPGHKSNLFRLVAKLLTEIDIKDVVVECLEIEFGDMVFIQLLYYVNVSFQCNWCHLYGHIEAYYSKEFICQIWKKKEETDYVKKTSINSQNTENMKNPKFGLTEGQGNQVDGVVKK